MTFEEKIIYIKQYLKGKYSIIPPVEEQVIEKFEKDNKVKLPEFYKYFVTNIALGIISIEKDNPFSEDILLPYDFSSFNEDDDPLENPKKKFPLIKPTYELYETDYDYYDITNGTILLKDTGCGNGERLIINGLAYGQIWIDEVMSNSEIYPAYKKEIPDDHFKIWINKSMNSKIKIKRNKKVDNEVDNEVVSYATKFTLTTIFIVAIILVFLFHYFG